MASGHSIVVDLKSLITLFNATADQALPDPGGKAAHRRFLCEREDVDGLDIDRFQVGIALGDGHFRAQSREARLNAYALEWDRDLTRCHQTAVQRCVHGCYSLLRLCGQRGRSLTWP